jgi:hypothetical protein
MDLELFDTRTLPYCHQLLDTPASAFFFLFSMTNNSFYPMTSTGCNNDGDTNNNREGGRTTNIEDPPTDDGIHYQHQDSMMPAHHQIGRWGTTAPMRFFNTGDREAHDCPPHFL